MATSAAHVRLDEKELERLDAVAGRYREEWGMPCTRSDVLRKFVLEGLELAERGEGKKRYGYRQQGRRQGQ